MNIKPRTIFCHDNLPVLRGINSNSIDLIYLDPPFNKGRHFHAPIGTTAEGADFSDIWTPDSVKDEWHNLINDKHPKLYKYLDSVGDIGSRSAKYYLIIYGRSHYGNAPHPERHWKHIPPLRFYCKPLPQTVNGHHFRACKFQK